LNTKIQRVCKDIEKSKEKISAEQAKLRDLERQKTELENLDIVNTVRGMNISFTDLAELLKQVNANAPTTSGQAGSKLNELAASAEAAPPTQDNDEEDME
jgi:hypothetical protein